MAHVVVTIAGRTYRMACDDGEEAHLESLAHLVEDKIVSLRGGFGEIGEQRIVVMAALTLADDAAAARKKLAALETEIAALRANVDRSRQNDAELHDKILATLNDAARRIERLADELSRKAPGSDEIS